MDNEQDLYIVQPLYAVRGWLKFIGIFNIVMGIIACITIVGAITGWLPIWIGVLLKNAANKLEAGVETGNPNLIHQGNQDLSTTAKIVGVLCIIQLCIMALYFLFLIVMVVLMIIGAAAGASAR